MASDPSDLAALYQVLNLPLHASLADVEQAYFRLKAEKIQDGRRDEIPNLKTAYGQLKCHLQAEISAGLMPDMPDPIERGHDSGPVFKAPSPQTFKQLQIDLFQLGFNAQVSQEGRSLRIQLSDRQAPKASQAVAKIHPWLKKASEQGLFPEEISTLKLSAHRNTAKPTWETILPLPGASSTFEDHDLTSFHSRLVQLFGFPGLLIFALILNFITPVKFLLRGVTIWFHEFGHATVAWLAGRKAIPLPFGWTNVDPQRSLFVYCGILVLLGLMGWAGYREQRKWPMTLAIAIAVLQFFMTWIMSTDRFEMLLAFGGIGGEFYLCTLLIVSFFFPLPEYFRWDIYRYPAVIGAAFTFWGSFGQWKQIKKGAAAIPWGSLWGGADHQGGDMNQLSYTFGWSDQQIINTYNHISALCLITILSIYLYFLIKNQRSHLKLFWHQCLAAYWK